MNPRSWRWSACAMAVAWLVHEASGQVVVRTCRFVPGVSVPAVMPAGVEKRATFASPPPKPLQVTRTSAEKTAQQVDVLNGLSNAVRDHYVYPDMRGRDWPALVTKYRARIQQGLSDEDFAVAMNALISELGDRHSYFQSPAVVKQEESRLASQYAFVGVGALFKPIEGTESAAILSLFAGGPAAQAGLRPHDILMNVDGGPIRDEHGRSRTLGAAGTPVTLTVRQPGETPRTLTLTRRQVSGNLPIDYCTVRDLRIGYLFLPTLLDKTMDGQVLEALRQMTAVAPLQGLVLDNRMNGGGLGSVAKAILEFFAAGHQGDFVSRATRDPLTLDPVDIGGSQTVPIVVLVDADTVSYGEILSGVLKLAGRATIVGGTTLGNVEQLRAYDFSDGSRAWLASATFVPRGLPMGIWEDAGIAPDVRLPTRWDLFTEANDPAFAKAVELLRQKGARLRTGR